LNVADAEEDGGDERADEIAGFGTVATAGREVEEEVEAEVVFAVAAGSEGSATSIARGLFGRPFGVAESNPCFISEEIR